jgi:transcriptional regulator with XRE-family HTH domain
MNNFRRFRLIQGLTQTEVADKLGVSTVTVSKWESGRCLPKVKRIKQVASVLHTTVPELLKEPRERSASDGKVAECG